jgi:tetraacyldisaccharide 4'-kinase
MGESRRIERIWEGEAQAPVLQRLALRVAASAWGVGRRCHRALYRLKLLRRVRLPCPVVSVGNLSVGGVGKTPFVAALARTLSTDGRRVLILARGYKRAPGAALNEEGEWLKSVVPTARVVQDPDRAGAAQRALAESPADVVILDDGFQHEALARDLDVVLVDATTGFGNGRLLPAGPLRERPDALRRADFVVLTRCEIATDEEIARARAAVAAAAPAVPLVLARLDLRELRRGDVLLPPSELFQCGVLLATGVGRPSAVERNVVSFGGEVVDHARFDDHHAYTRGEVEALIARARQRGVWLATTAKDAVKWDALLPDRRGDYVVLEQGFALTDGRAAFEAALQKVVGGDPEVAVAAATGASST